jgi:hypothetical protein
MGDPLHGERAYWHWTDLVVGEVLRTLILFFVEDFIFKCFWHAVYFE